MVSQIKLLFHVLNVFSCREMSGVLAETFLARSYHMDLLCDAIVTDYEFREFCNAIGIPPMERLKFAQKNSEERVFSTLRYWFKTNPNVADLKRALEKWGHLALIARLRLDDAVEEGAGNEVEERKEQEGLADIVDRPVFQQSKPIAVPNSKKQVEEKDVFCVVCDERGREVAFIPCGHRCCCSLCSNRLESKTCPMCRQQFTSVLRVFG